MNYLVFEKDSDDEKELFNGEHICPVCKKRWNLTFKRMGKLFNHKHFDMKCSGCDEKFRVYWTGNYIGYDLKYI